MNNILSLLKSPEIIKNISFLFLKNMLSPYRLYKLVLRYLTDVDPMEAKLKSLREKSQNRLLFSIALIGVFATLFLYYYTSFLNPLLILITLLSLAQLKFKRAKFNKPIQYISLFLGIVACMISPTYLLPPAVTIYSNFHFMIYTGSHTLSIFQFLLNAFITNFFALEWLGVELKEMGTEASSQRCLFSLRQGLCFSYVIALILHVQKYEQDKLIRKIEQLSEALDEKNKNVTKKK